MNKVDAEQELIDRVAEEFAERCRRGQQPSIGEYAQRYPAIADKLKELLPPVALMEQLKRKRRPAGPSAGDEQRLERLGDYSILREIGRGGMGIVYEARQESLDRRVALKILPRHSLLDPKRLARFRIEAQAAARMHHTNIVPVFGLFEGDGLFYYAMQFIEGQGLHEMLASLKQGQWARETKGTKGNNRPTRKFTAVQPHDLVTRTAPLADAMATGSAAPIATARLPVAVGQQPVRGYWDQVAAIGLQVADALQYAHDQGVLHRDIKPANLLLDGRGSVWVTDFGLAKLLEHADLTSTGDVVGTLLYMAPESIHGQFDARSDVYSLGLTLYELLTLEAPFAETNPAKLLKLVSEHEPLAPRRHNPAIPRDLETIVLKAISREPNHRYPTARRLAADLRRFLDDKPIKARRVAALERGWRWCRRNRALASLTATALGSLLIAAVVGCWGYASTTSALKSESERRSEAEVATERAEANMQLSLEALQSIFAALAERQAPPQPPLRARGPRPGGPPEMAHFPDQDHRRPGPPPDQDGHRPNGPPQNEREQGRRGQDEFDAALLQTVLTFYDRFAERNATDPKLKIEAAQAYCRVADAQSRLGQQDKAAIAYGRAADVCNVLHQEFPDDPRVAATLADVDLNWATLPTATTETAEAKKSQTRAQEAIQLAAKLAARFPEQPDYVALQARGEQTLGIVFERQEKPREAEEHFRRAIPLQRALIQMDGMPHNKVDHFVEELAAMERGLVKLLLEQERPADAKSYLEASLTALEDAKPMPHVQDALENVYEIYADVLTDLGEKDKADKMQDKADEISNHHPPDRPPGGPRGPHGPHHGPPGGHHPGPPPNKGPGPPPRGPL